jgi:hypothetical protein
VNCTIEKRKRGFEVVTKQVERRKNDHPHMHSPSKALEYFSSFGNKYFIRFFFNTKAAEILGLLLSGITHDERGIFQMYREIGTAKAKKPFFWGSQL